MTEINFLNILQVLVAIALIGFILIQRGPGATAGSAFGGGGGGASGTVFGAKGSGSFLSKSTAILATAFFIITMLIAIDARNTYAASGDAAVQDLGVIGSLDDAGSEPVVVPADGAENVPADVSAVIDAVDEAATDAVNEVNSTVDQAATEVQTAVEQAAEPAESDDTDDSDGDGNN